MFYRKRAFRAFTIVELLIVVVVIAILAALSIISYNGITNRAKETLLKSDLASAAKQLDLTKVQTGSYPNPAAEHGLAHSPITTLRYSYDGEGYCVSAELTSNPSLIFSLRQGGQIVPGGCELKLDSIAAGLTHTCGVASSKVFCWGGNGLGTLGDGTTTNRLSPVAVDTSGVLAGKAVSSVVVGSGHSCALAEGAVYCWGYNNNGQLGDGTTTNRLSPVAVDTSGVLAGKTVSAISGTALQTCALADGAVYCWGNNGSGRLGDGTTTNRLSPVAVDTSGVLAGRAVTSIAVGANHGCVLADGLPFCWGANGAGQLGNNTTVSYSSTPVAVDVSGVLAGKTSVEIGLGSVHSCVLADGRAYCWGSNTYRQLGDDTSTTRRAPVIVRNSYHLGQPVSAISIGPTHNCILVSGKAYCWGDGTNGKLSYVTESSYSSPSAINTSGALTPEHVITGMSLGADHTCAVSDDNTFCWGSNSSGQLGDGTTEARVLPTLVLPLP